MRRLARPAIWKRSDACESKVEEVSVNCPRDGAALERREVHARPIDVCPTCGGMYLQRGELRKVADDTAGDVEFSTVELDSLEHADATASISCPHDGQSMQKVEFNIETDIILDHCLACHGFWVDGDELTRINAEIARLNDAAKEVPDPALTRLTQFFWNLPLPH